jgi:hypothetical protein
MGGLNLPLEVRPATSSHAEQHKKVDAKTVRLYKVFPFGFRHEPMGDAPAKDGLADFLDPTAKPTELGTGASIDDDTIKHFTDKSSKTRKIRLLTVGMPVERILPSTDVVGLLHVGQEIDPDSPAMSTGELDHDDSLGEHHWHVVRRPSNGQNYHVLLRRQKSDGKGGEGR